MPAAMADFTFNCFLFAVFALTVTRILPIAISLAGLKLGAHLRARCRLRRYEQGLDLNHLPE